MEVLGFVQKKKHLPKWQVLSSQILSFWYIVVDFDNEAASDFVIKVNTAQMVGTTNNVIKSSVVSTIWAG